MTAYLFEYLIGNSYYGTQTVIAVDSLDAFDQFRALYPHVVISHVWVEFPPGRAITIGVAS